MTQVPVELLGCPFCGGEATLSTYETESLWSHNRVTYTQVGCEECNYSFATEPGFEMEAPERWNTRTPVAAQAELVADIRKAVARAGERIGGVEIEQMNGDNLAVTLCSHFDNPDQEQDDNGWSEDATEGCDATLEAIHARYVEALGDALAKHTPPAVELGADEGMSRD